MKILMVDSSPHIDGNTATALRAMEDVFRQEGVEVVNFYVGKEPLSDCTACGSCAKTGRCAFNERANDLVDAAKEADAFIFASPVYYAHPSGRLLSLLDCAFYSGSAAFAYKPAGSVSASRRGGSESSYDVINKYAGINHMPIVSSSYWNDIHGAAQGEAEADVEGLNTAANLARNMVWIMRCIEAGAAAGIDHPDNPKEWFSFVR